MEDTYSDPYDAVFNSFLLAVERGSNVAKRGALACVTGRFSRGTHAEIAALLRAKGYRVASRVTRDTDVLFVGHHGSPCWLSENGGRKISVAHRYSVKITQENDMGL